MSRTRILFISEAVTLAHVGRPLALSQSLDPERYEVHFACDPRARELLAEGRFEKFWPIRSIPSEQFLRALAQGTPLYDFNTLSAYAFEDDELLAAVRPDVVVGDFRISLGVSARQAKVTYLAISNAYWSPYAPEVFPLPEHPSARILGVKTADFFFQRLRPLIFAIHTRPMNQLRRAHGMEPLDGLRSIYTDGDYTLYADIPGLVPLSGAPPEHRFIGPVLWTPPAPVPQWLDDLPTSRPTVYVSLGSSGAAARLKDIVAAVSDLDVNVIVTTAGRANVDSRPGSVWVADFADGDELARRSTVVVCNGGSPTVYQALARGRPVIGVPSNMDQHLNMHYVGDFGAGLSLKGGLLAPERMRRSVAGILAAESYQVVASGLARKIDHWNAGRRFPSLLAEIVKGG